MADAIQKAARARYGQETNIRADINPHTGEMKLQRLLEVVETVEDYDKEIALETAHYGYVLEIGRVVMNDTCERLMNSPDIQEFYLGAKEAGARGERRWKKKKTWR